MTDKLVPSSDALVQDLRSLIEATRGRVAQTVNSELVALYWQVGRRLREKIELLELTEGSVRVASYLTELPPRELLERKLLESIEHACARALAGDRLALSDSDG